MWNIGVMAWRIEQAVIRGEIDNTVAGRTTGKIWLEGRERPLILNLEGDCLRDLAGCRLMFANPRPVADPDAISLSDGQNGTVGDITASRRCRVPKDSDQPFDPERGETVWKNILYVEWFSRINGRVLIEAEDFELRVSEPQWQMDEDDEVGQELSNLHEMREFVRQVLGRKEIADEDRGMTYGMNEFEWEARLKESDRLSDAYQEVLEKYLDDPDGEKKEAFVMGWDGLLDAMAQRSEGDGGDGEDFPAESEDAEETGAEFWWREEDSDPERSHPLQARAQELALRAMDLVERESIPETPAQALLGNLLQVTGKLAGALNAWDGDDRPEPGLVLAILKRCLNWLNEALSSCQELIAVETEAEQRQLLLELRASIHEIRQGVTELRRELK